MSYKSETLLVLVSAPGDVPEDHLRLVQRVINRWNVHYGRTYGITVVPLGWTEHAVAAFGDRPQALINTQLTEIADMGIALFRDRLGSDTGVAPSGTVEEIQVLVDAGKPVAILRDDSPRPPTRNQDGIAQMGKLHDYFQTEAYPKALIRGHTTELELSQHVDAFINREALQFQERIRAASQPRTADGRPMIRLQAFAVGERGTVVPRIETVVRRVKDPCSATRTIAKTQRVVVVANQTGWEVRNVRFRFEVSDGEVFDADAAYPTVPIMTADSEFRFDVNLSRATTDLAQCVVTWDDNDGEHTSEITVQA